MALRDITKETLYSTLERFLTSNIGKRWDKVYSKICAVADSRTDLGREIRDAVNWKVDERPDALMPSDYYVDADGLLQPYPHRRAWWRHRSKIALNNKPIDEIHFIEDGSNLWYKLVDVPNGPRVSKYTKMHQEWFKVVRTEEVHTRPLKNWEEGIILTEVKKGKKAYYKTYTVEVCKETQCNKKMVALLHLVARRQSSHKILKLLSSYDSPTSTAYVTGSSGK